MPENSNPKRPLFALIQYDPERGEKTELYPTREDAERVAEELSARGIECEIKEVLV